MTALGALPPAFLLPAWNHSQLILVTSRTLSRNTQCQFSTSQARANDIELSQQPFTRQFTEVEHNGRAKVVRTYASKKERRIRESIEAIKSRIERYGGISSTTQSQAERQIEDKREKAILAHYNQKQRASHVEKEQQWKNAMLLHHHAKHRSSEHINISPINRPPSAVDQSIEHIYRTQLGHESEPTKAVDVRSLKPLEDLSTAGNDQVNQQQALEEGSENGEGGNNHHADKEFKRNRIPSSCTYQSLIPVAQSKRSQGVKLPMPGLKVQQGKQPEIQHRSKVNQAEPQLLTRQIGREEISGLGSLGPAFRSLRTTPLNAKESASLSEPSQAEQGHSEESANPKKSLLEELFPEEAAKVKQQAQATLSKRREAPKLPLPNVNEMQHGNVAISEAKIVPKRTPSTSTQPDKEIGALLILENALPDLVEADFRRVPPKGKHISEWNPIYNPTAVIPARGGPSARCIGKYYLVFDSLAGAKTWRDRLRLLHRIVQQHAPRSLNSFFIPPNGFVSGDQDIGELLTEYSIFSHNTVPKMRLYGKPHADPEVKPELHEVLARLQPNKKKTFTSGRSVLLWIDGWTGASTGMITNMITQNGHERHMLWNEEAGKLPVEAYENDVVSRQEDTRHDGTSSKSHQPKKWIVTLRDEAEARRFIRVWHLKLFPDWPGLRPDAGDGSSEEPWPVIRTELLW